MNAVDRVNTLLKEDNLNLSIDDLLRNAQHGSPFSRQRIWNEGEDS